MESKKLVPNLALRSAIAEWRVTHALPIGEQIDATTSSGDEASMEVADGGTLAIDESKLPAKAKGGRTKKARLGTARN